MQPKLEDISIHAWIQQHQIKTEKGVMLDFKDHLFLFDPYTDMSPKLVVYKAAQIGLSTLQIFKTFFIAKKLGLDVIYTLPTQDDAATFVDGKVNRMIANNPVLQEYTQDKDTIERKRVGKGMLYYRGTFTKKAAIMVTADVLVHDEEDFSDQDVVADYESRLQHSKAGWHWHFGHPSTEGVGVSKYWKRSDQKHWFIKCPKCNKEQYLSWPESIDIKTEKFVCKECGGEITDNARRKGRWVAKYKDKEYSGYWIPLMIAPWVSAKRILEYYRDKTDEYFFNRVLGLPYVGSGNRVTRDDIMGNLTSEINKQKDRIVIGVDTGIELRYVVGNKDGLFYYGQTKKYEEIEYLMKRWERSIVVMDAGGDLIGSRQLREKYPGRVFLAHYSQDRKTMQLIRWGKADESGNVVVDRNRVIQIVVDEFKDRRIPLQGTDADWQDYWLHWNAVYRMQDEDSLGVIRKKWLRSGRDDWVHATVYWRVGMSRYGTESAGIFGDDELKFKESPTIDESGRMPAINPNELIGSPKEEDWRLSA